ncbi:Inducer of phenazine A [Micromonospora sp. NPDC049559]|uniref:Inducer of phenazine A n=1 Tax=Micromonospora sp. NPDC049559 TaxID=3155923 RepID=UPI00341F3EE6
MSARSDLTPQMSAYADRFADSGLVRWHPNLIYFHPAKYRSTVVNTDSAGFRYSHRDSTRYSPVDHAGIDSVRLIAGSSTVFGIGASSDAWTLASRMSTHDRREQPWMNFGGRSFNSTQELLLLVLYRHLLPRVDEIVLFSGFNNLGLARMPESRQEEHGTFFMYTRWHEAFDGADRTNKPLLSILRKREPERVEPVVPSLPEQLRYAADLTIRHLDGWRALAADWGAKLTFVLQPLSGWVRPRGTVEEEALFAELDAIGRFSEQYGDILDPDICTEYATLLEDQAKAMGVGFVNMSPILSESLRDDQWLFVDRIHFTDDGHDFVARKLLEVV